MPKKGDESFLSQECAAAEEALKNEEREKKKKRDAEKAKEALRQPPPPPPATERSGETNTLQAGMQAILEKVSRIANDQTSLRSAMETQVSLEIESKKIKKNLYN